MNKTKLKSYAPQARKDFIAAVTARANLLGLSDKNGQLQIASSQPQGDITLIAGQPWPAKVHGQRQQLIARLQKDGFAQTLEAVAYTWFNRFAALRYMELHDYLGHGHRALSSAEGGLPDILTHAADLAQSASLPGLSAAQVIDMKLAGNRDGELYRLLLVAQCNALSVAMPFLFERIDDETELLLPDNLLRTDSVIAKLVAAIDEEDWREVEIIGWLYQFYISEKKDAVIGKVVKSEDIPAATQLFTPNWIVQYLVQNSVGRLWLMANPASTLASQWPYYIQPAEQTPEVNAQLDALIQTRMEEDGGSLNPETIIVLDPACGSGHILVVAYDVLKAIYLERGYQPRAIPRLILEKNLFGLDIDDRAAQLAGFALLMKARADDRRLFNEPVQLNVLALQESKGLDAGELTRALASSSLPPPLGEGRGGGYPRVNDFSDNDLFPATHPQMTLGESDLLPLPLGEGWGEGSPLLAIRLLIDTFLHAKTFGSLIQIPAALNAALPALLKAVQQAQQSGDLYGQAAAQDLWPLVAQARVLGMQFDAVVANPPYMGIRYYDGILKPFIESKYEKSKGDLYTCFILRSIKFAKGIGSVGMITIPNWMFLSTFEELRKEMFDLSVVEQFLHNGRGVFGSDFGSCAFTLRLVKAKDYKGKYKRLFDKQGSVSSNEELSSRFGDAVCFVTSATNLARVPGLPLAYWISEATRSAFEYGVPLGTIAIPKQGLATADNDRFVRRWTEVDFGLISFDCSSVNTTETSKYKWYPYNKGGEFRRWYGNQEFVVNWKGNGQEIKSFVDGKGKVRSRPQNSEYYFRKAISWSDITSATTCFRYFQGGFIHDVTGMSAFPPFEKELEILGFCNSIVAGNMVKILNPTVHFQVGDFFRLPYISLKDSRKLNSVVDRAVYISRADWNMIETSWGYEKNPLVDLFNKSITNFRLEGVWQEWRSRTEAIRLELLEIEKENNRFFIDAYGLQDELSPEVPESQITLVRADREKDCQRLISYAIGCMMGRYSLDAPGLIYAHAGNVGFDASRYPTFPADADGIVPLTDELWFEDDAANRISEFLLAVWGPDTLKENMAWLAESLGAKTSETPEETIRRYLADKFFKDHLQTYKKRPIYWLFSSGKQGAFQALVYLHRYHEGTLARVRAEYVVPLTGKIQSRIDMLQKDALAAPSTAARTKLAKEVEKLKKKHAELLAYDEQLRHHADMRITLDLDDGVKVNYGKFGNLLAEVKAVTGGKDEE